MKGATLSWVTLPSKDSAANDMIRPSRRMLSARASMLWKTTDGNDLSGLGWIVLKLAGQKVRFEGIATVMGRTRWGLKATVRLEGSGTVKTNGLECQEGCDG